MFISHVLETGTFLGSLKLHSIAIRESTVHGCLNGFVSLNFVSLKCQIDLNTSHWNSFQW